MKTLHKSILLSTLILPLALLSTNQTIYRTNALTDDVQAPVSKMNASQSFYMTGHDTSGQEDYFTFERNEVIPTTFLDFIFRTENGRNGRVYISLPKSKVNVDGLFNTSPYGFNMAVYTPEGPMYNYYRMIPITDFPNITFFYMDYTGYFFPIGSTAIDVEIAILNNVVSPATLLITDIVFYNTNSFIEEAQNIASALNTVPYFEGYEDGNGDGYRDGLSDGYDNGYDDGNLDGYNSGLVDNEAYDLGFNKGAEDSFLANLKDWIVPAIIVVLFLGGALALWSNRRKNSGE